MTIKAQSQTNPEVTNNLHLLTDSYLEVLNYFMRRSHLPSMYFTHKTIASSIKRSTKTVERAIEELISLGFLHRYKGAKKTPNTYFLTDALQKITGFVRRYLFQMLWGISISLLSSAAPARNVCLLKDNDYNVLKNSLSRFVNQTVFYENNNKQYDNCTEKHDPNPKLSFEQFDLLLTTDQPPTIVAASTEVDVLREQVELLGLERSIKKEMTESMMQDLTLEQLEQLAQFPTETISYAHKTLTRDMAAGKGIRDPFAYLMGICNVHIKTNKTPKTGQAVDNRSGAKPLYTAPITVQETSFEWCLKVEPNLHKFTLERHPGMYMTKSYADAHWEKLSRQEQQTLIELYHPDCSCRKLTAPEGQAKTVVNKSWAQEDHLGTKRAQAESMGISTHDKTYGELCRAIAEIKSQ